MNLVFLNSLEKEAGDGRVRRAQVSICEDKGLWHVFWTVTLDDGKERQDCWYEGRSWEEMIHHFRERIQEKIAEGYTPIMKESLSSPDKETLPFPDVAAGMNASALLQYYGEKHANPHVYDALRGWRKERAVRDGKSPFIVATNSMLQMISAFLPHTLEELRQIPGWRKHKTDLYGEEIVAITQTAERSTGFPLDWVIAKVDMEKFQHWLAGEIRRKNEAQRLKRQQKQKLLEVIGHGGELSVLQRELSLRRRDLLLMIEELDKEGYDIRPLIETELKTVSDSKLKLAWQAFEEEGDRYLKPVAQKVFANERMAGHDLMRAYEWLRLLRLKYRKEKGLA